jgi:tetratricopeptide (TPR) repeat protein
MTGQEQPETLSPPPGWLARYFHPLQLRVDGETTGLSRRPLFFAFALMAAGLAVTLVPERLDGAVLGDISSPGGGSYVPSLCFLIGDLCLATGVWAAVAAARNRVLERGAIAGLGIISAALTGHCVRLVWQVVLLRKFYLPPGAFTGAARWAAVGWGAVLTIVLTAGFAGPLLVAAANLVPRVLADLLPPIRWLARRRWWLLLPFAALAATLIITQWVLPTSLATDMGYSFPTFSGATGIVPLRALGTASWTSLQILFALPLLLGMWEGIEAARTCQRLVRKPKGGQTVLLTHVRRIDYRFAAAASLIGVTYFAVAKGSGLSALAGAGLLLMTALSFGGDLGRAARLSKGFERRVRRWQLPEEWRDLGRVSLLLAVLLFPALLVLAGDVLYGVKNGLWFPFDLSKFYFYWQYYDLIGIPSITASGIFGHVDTVIWEACLGLSAIIFFGMLIQRFSKDVRDGFKPIWFLLRVALFAVALAPVMRMADHSYATFVLAGCAVLATVVTARREVRPEAVWSAIIVGGALALWSLALWRTDWLPAAAMLCLTILQRFVYNAGDLNERSDYRPNRVAYFQAIALLSVGMLALGHGAATGFFQSDELSTVSDRVSMSVVAAIWLVMLVARQTRRTAGAKGAAADGKGGTGDEAQEELPDSWAWLLEPHRALVRFIGRDDELATLLAWCDDERAELVRLVTGPGGTGKTRLAAELAGRLSGRGWQVIWLPRDHDKAAVDAWQAAEPGRLLLVVDEAETRSGLGPVLGALAGSQNPVVRILLLARYTGAWLDQLTSAAPSLRSQVQLARRARLALPVAVTTAIPDHTILAKATGSFARKFGLREPRVQTRYKTTAARQLIADLHAAALVATLIDAGLAETGTGTVEADIRTPGLTQLLAHERQFWLGKAKERGLFDGADQARARLLRQVIAVGCLFGAATAAQACDLAKRLPGFVPSGEITGWLDEVLAANHHSPGPGTFLPLARLAEWHTLGELSASSEFTRACTTGLTGREALAVVTFLARAVPDFTDASPILAEILPGLTGRITDLGSPAGTLTAVLNILPYPRPALAPAAATLIRQLLDLLDASAEPAARAHWLMNLALRLAETDDVAGAVAAEQEAVLIRNGLADADPDRYLPDLAASLSSVSARLGKLGDHRNALLAGEEAVAIYRGLAGVSPGRYGLFLALSMNGLALRDEEAGRAEEMLKAFEDAVSVYRDLAAINPSQYRPGLAGALGNISFRYKEQGDFSKAVPVAEEAVACYRKLATVKPAEYRPKLATALDNLGVYLSHADRPADAMPATQEAIDIFKQLAKASPSRYHDDLFRARKNLRIRQKRLKTSLP